MLRYFYFGGQLSIGSINIYVSTIIQYGVPAVALQPTLKLRRTRGESWNEAKITVRFNIISLMLCLLALITLKIR